MRILVMMTKRTLDISQQLKIFRSQLFNIDKNDDNLQRILNELLDKHRADHFDAFAEEYVIAGFDVELVGNCV